jgi:hypothetical protein
MMHGPWRIHTQALARESNAVKYLRVRVMHGEFVDIRLHVKISRESNAVKYVHVILGNN